MTGLSLFYAAVAFVAAAITTQAPRDQRGGLCCVAMIWLAAWALFVTSWSDWSLASLLWRAGVPIRSEKLWAMSDLAVGLAAIRLGYRWLWGWLLLSLAVVQELIHYAGDPTLNSLPYLEYNRLLDGAWLVQASIFISVGGAGASDRISRYFDRRRFRRGSCASACARAEES